jgi:hypothetical protein
VGANAVKGVPLCREAQSDRSCADGNTDVSCNHMDSWTDEAERSRCRHVVRIDGFDSSSQGSHWAEGPCTLWWLMASPRWPFFWLLMVRMTWLVYTVKEKKGAGVR